MTDNQLKDVDGLAAPALESLNLSGSLLILNQSDKSKNVKIVYCMAVHVYPWSFAELLNC